MNDLSDRLAEALEAQGATFVDVYRDRNGYQASYYVNADDASPTFRETFTQRQAELLVDEVA